MFMCLGLDLVCYAMCYCIPFLTFVSLSYVLAYWFRPDLDPIVFVIVHTSWPTSKGLDHSYLHVYACLLLCFYACVSLSSSRICHIWGTLRAWPCVVTSNAHEALFGCNHLGGISECQVAPCVPFPFSALLNVMLSMLVCATRWLSMHLHTLAYMFMHESCLVLCRPYLNTMKLWTFDPNLHLSLAKTSFCLLSCLFAFLLVCLLFGFFACHAYHAYPLYAFSYALCIFFFPLLVYWFLVFAFVCTHMKQGRMELGHILPSASKKGTSASMSTRAKRLCSVGLRA